MLLLFALKGFAQFPAPYCGPLTFSNNREPITMVQFAGINNTSPAATGGDGHQNFTAISGSVAQGITYPITIKGNTDGPFVNHFTVFIDWNQNNVFTDAGETYQLGTLTTSTGVDAVVLTGNIAVPATATLGTTRMRVTKKYIAPSDSCNTPGTGWGEAEDYSLTVTTPPCTPPTVTFAKASLCPAATFNVTAQFTALGTSTTYQVNDNQQSPTQTVTATGTVTFGPYPSGTEVVLTVTDPNASLCNVTSSTLTDICAPGCVSGASPANGAVNVPFGPITFNWTAPTTGGPIVGYDLYLGNTADDLGFFDTYETTTTGNDIEIIAYGATVYWQVIAYNAGGEAVGCPVWSFTIENSPGYCLNATNGLFPSATFTPTTCDGVTPNDIVTNAYAGEYSNVAVTAGQTYKFISGTTDFVTIGNQDGGVALAYGPSPLTWVATATETVRFYSHVNNQCGAQSVNRTRSVICGVPAADAPDFVSLQWPPNATIIQGGSFTVYGQVYEPGLTDPAGQAAGITAWVGINNADTDPSTWTTWIPMTYNAEATNTGNNDEYMATIGSNLAPGAYFYATRFRLNAGGYVYGGISADNVGGIWDEPSFTNGELTVSDPPAPANDLCSAATPITAGGTFAANVVTGTVLGATTTTGMTYSCQPNRANDVWYTVTVPASGTLTVETRAVTGSTFTDGVLSVFSGTCGSLVEVGCDDDLGEGNFSFLELEDLTPGATLYIGVWRWDNANNIAGSFQLSAYDASLKTGDVASSQFSVYPNPVKNVLNVSADSTIKTATVYNILGQQVLQVNLNAQQGSVDMASLSKGAYIVKLQSENASQSIKVIKE